MNRLVPLAAFLLPGCALIPKTDPKAPIEVFSRSHNDSKVEVWLLCGRQNATWLGTVVKSGSAGFEVAAERARCLPGWNFFLIVQESGRGYWTGPVRPQPGGVVVLVIEKYAGLSVAEARWEP
jgi:hypothetical protein